MNIDNLIQGKHEKIVFKNKGDARMILAYHTLDDGVSFGGIRLVSGSANEALRTALRLSEAMTYKIALIDRAYTGSKAVVFHPENGKTKEFLHDIGRLIQEEDGKFISAIDFGFEPNDANIIEEKTEYILALKDSDFGQSGITTALGVIDGIKASLKHIYGSDDISKRSFAIQGLGSVGSKVADELIESGGKVYVSDTDESKLENYRGIVKIIPPDKILFSKVDVLSPCGPPYIINKETIPYLNSRIIAGGANCQLKDEKKDDKRLFDKGILIAPDYAINSGGVIQGIEELEQGSLDDAISKLPIISKNLNKIYKTSSKKGIGTYAVAKDIAIQKRKENKPICILEPCQGFNGFPFFRVEKNHEFRVYEYSEDFGEGVVGFMTMDEVRSNYKPKDFVINNNEVICKSCASHFKSAAFRFDRDAEPIKKGDFRF